MEIINLRHLEWFQLASDVSNQRAQYYANVQKFSRNYVERCLRKCIFCPNGQIVEVCIVPLNLVAVRSAAGKRQGGRPVEMISNHAARSLAARLNSHQAERHNGALEKSGVSNNRHLEKLGGIQ